MTRERSWRSGQDRARDARTVQWLATRGLLLLLILLPASQLINARPLTGLVVYLPGIAIMGAMLAMTYLGWVRAATITAPILLYLLATAVMVALGLHGSHGFIYIFAIFYAGLFWRPLAVAVMVALTAVTMLLYLRAMQEGMVPQPLEMTDMRMWLGASSAVIVAALIVTAAIRNERAAIAAAIDSERARHASERKLAELVNQSPDGVLSFDDRGVITSVNPAAETLLGIDAAALVGAPVERLELDGTGLDLLARIRELPPGETLGPVLLRLPTSAGEEPRMVEANGRRLTVADGALEALVTLRDVTDRHQLEQQLVRAQRMEALGQLASGVAHEFNNGLSVILANSSYLLRRTGQGDPKLHDCLQDIKASCVRAAALTRQLLAFSRNQVYESELVYPNEVLLAMREMLERTLGEDIQLRVEVGPDVGAVWLDRSQLEQAILNLCVNARAALPGGGHLTITSQRLIQDAPAGELVEIRVADDGTGMPSEVQDRIFEPFFTTKAPDEGTGLGLAMVRTFVERSGGKIRVESEPGHGTVFYLRFPVREPVEAGADTLPGGAGVAPVTPRPSVVLLVENDELVRRSARRILEDAGHTVIAAEGAETALALCDRHLDELDVLVSDIVMPGMSGSQLADILRERRPDLGIVLMSGHADPVKSGLDVRRHELCVLAKPFSPDSLLERVERSRAEARPNAQRRAQ